MGDRLSKIDNFCDSKPGIVTAANNYFIVNKETVEEYYLHDFVEPIIQKGVFVNGSVVFNNKDFNKIVNESRPAFLIKMDEDTEIDNHHPINEYFQIGQALELDKRYKMTLRDNWTVIPNIVKPAHGLFFKRCNQYPKLLKNYAGVLATDSAYVISMKRTKKIESLIFSFYNSLSLAYAEFTGRFYGGGVLELIPSEFKKLPVPYMDITSTRFTTYTKRFSEKKHIKEICSANDEEILNTSFPGITTDDINRISLILGQLHNRRLRIGADSN
jgi:adenine-specific DNA-methyltransferase